VLIARMLGAEDFGIYSLFFGILTVIFEAQNAINITYVRFSRTNETQEKSVILKASFFIQLSIAGVLIVGGWPVSLLLADILSLKSPMVIFWGFACGGLLSLFRIWFGVYQETGDFGKLGLLLLTFNFFILTLLAGTWLIGKKIDVSYIFLLYFSVSLAMGFVSLILLWKKCGKEKTESVVFRAMLRMTVMNMGVSLCYFLYRFVDIFFIKYYLDFEAVGMYAAAMKTSTILNIMTGSMTTILLPKAMDGIKSSKALRSYFVKSYTMSLYIVLLFVVFAIISPYLLDILFGKKFTDASPVLRVLVLGWAFNVLYIPIMQILYAINRVGLRLFLEISKIVCLITFFVLLIPKFGGMGAAWSLLIAICFSLVLGTGFVYGALRKYHFTVAGSL
jgi:O-antigen/teichoic acid export membrane protein